MENNKTKIYTIVSVIIIACVILGIWQMNQGGGNVGQVLKTASSNQPSTAGSGVQKSLQPISPNSGKPVSATTYASGLSQLDAEQNFCSNNATKQNTDLYSSLGQSSFQSYYNTNTGICYEKLSGVIIQPYSTTTAGAMYFRNVSSNYLMMECIDDKGVTLADGDWQCTDKSTGLGINLAQFNAMIYSYTAK